MTSNNKLYWFFSIYFKLTDKRYVKFSILTITSLTASIDSLWLGGREHSDESAHPI